MKFLITPPLLLVNFRRGVVLQVGYAVLPSHFIADSLSTRGVCLIIPIYVVPGSMEQKSDVLDQ